MTRIFTLFIMSIYLLTVSTRGFSNNFLAIDLPESPNPYRTLQSTIDPDDLTIANFEGEYEENLLESETESTEEEYLLEEEFIIVPEEAIITAANVTDAVTEIAGVDQGAGSGVATGPQGTEVVVPVDSSTPVDAIATTSTPDSIVASTPPSLVISMPDTIGEEVGDAFSEVPGTVAADEEALPPVGDVGVWG